VVVSAITAQPSGSPDEALVGAFGRGERWAAEELYRRFAGSVFGLGLRLLGHSCQAEDLVRDTFVRMWRTAGSYDPARGSAGTWILLLARSLALDALRRRGTGRRALARPLREPPGPQQSGPENLALTGDLARRARTPMAGLTPGQRTALELAYFGGKTAAQVAQIQGIPAGTARSRIRAALLRLHRSAAGGEAVGLEPAGDGADSR
jgi:RNA polymerase sigma-70 factor (ECF subfamily)